MNKKFFLALLALFFVFAFIAITTDRGASIAYDGGTSKQTLLQRAEAKVANGRASELTGAEADSWRVSNQSKDQAYHILAKQKLKEKLAKYSQEDQLIHAELIQEFDKEISARLDFDPAIHNSSIYEKIAKKHKREVKSLEDMFLEMQEMQILSKSEVDELTKKSGF
jgi:hypothetical protein